jgi:subtilisin-like proprotein convertase family protein/guanyl-specific ribonuclease Sa
MNTIFTLLPVGKRCFFITLLFLCIFAPNILAQKPIPALDFWKTTTIASEVEIVRTSPLPSHFQAYNLNVAELKNTLSSAPERFAHINSELIISLPQTDGTLANFQVYKSSVFSEDLAKKYPNLSSFYLQNVDNQKITARLNITSQGIYALISHPQNGLTYLEPYSQTNANYYIAYQAKDLGTTEQHGEFSCNVTEELETASLNKSLQNTSPDCLLRKYRLCISATGEYTQWHGGAVANAMEKIMVLTANTNLVFEQETGVTFELVDNNDLMIFTDPESDPFTNDNKFLLLSENQTATDNIIGFGNYDLGIVVGIVGGGVAQVKSVCSNHKAQSSAGSTWSPEGYPLEATFIHEIGHKFGATHSFNNSCNNNRANSTAYETGSGSTLMSYAGACAPSVTYPRDFYFHTGNLNQMLTFIQFDLLNGCGEVISLGNIPPTAFAGADRSLPVGIPFELTGTSNNFDNSPQRFNWEQIDIQVANAPPTSNSGVGPAFRSFPPKEVPERTFPSIDCLINPANSDCEWEVLPDVTRNMTFTFTAYDATEGAGCWASDNISLIFVEREEDFAVEYPNGTESFTPNQNIDIQWNKGQTDASPVNCSSVDIFLSTDGGYSFPITLAEDIPNTGLANLQLPNINSENCRIKIKGHSNYFFDLSDDNFTIEAPGDFTLNPVTALQAFCGDVPNTVSFEIEVTALGNFNSPISFPTSDNTGGTSISFTPSQVMPPATVTAQITSNWISPITTFDISASSGDINHITTLIVQNSDSQPFAPQPISPAANILTTEFDVNFLWSFIQNAESYDIEISENADFSDLFFTSNSRENSLEVSDLESLKIYYWRVRSNNACGQSAWSDIYAFRTKKRTCSIYPAVNTPRDINSENYTDAFARIDVEDDFIISKIKIKDLHVDHTHIGDLSGNLICPDGESMQLFYRPGLEDGTPYGCVHDDLLLTFSEDAVLSNEELRATCNPVPDIGISGEYQPAESFASVLGHSSYGPWLVNINDLSPEDGGVLTDVSLELCRDDIQPTNSLNLFSNTLEVEQFNSATIGNNLLNLSDATGTFQILSLPQNGNLQLYNSNVSIGSTFTIVDLASGALVYTQNGSPTLSDAFFVDATSSNDQWSGIHEFSIDIVLSSPFPTGAITQYVSCPGENDAAINVYAEFGTPPYQFSIDGENFQYSGNFENLSAGSYTVFVLDAAGNNIAGQTIFINDPQTVTGSAYVENHNIIASGSGGTGDLEYSLDGINFQSENVFTTEQDGYYEVTIRDENGCNFTSSTVLVNNLATSLSLTQGLTCHDDAIGSVEVSTTNGIPPFQYRLNQGEYQLENTFENLPAGEYTAVVRDATDLIISTQTVTILNPEELTASATTDGYMVEINTQNDQSPFLYSINGAEFTDINTFSGPPQSEYTIIVQNAVGCTFELSASINILPPAILAVETEDIFCYNGDNGEITVTATEGVPPYEYKFENFDFQDDNSFSNLEAGTYIVQIRDSGGFISEIQEVQIFEPNQLQLSASSQDGNLIANANGGTGTLMYSLDNGDFQESPIFSDLANGIYEILVQDEYDCQRMITYIHTTNSLSVSTQSQVINPCDLETTIEIMLCAEGGITPYEISSIPAAMSITEMETEECEVSYILEYPAGSTGSVELMTSDFLGTQFTNIINLQISDTLAINHSLNEDNLTITSISGTPPFQYSIDGINYQDSGYFPDLENGTYPIYAIDANGCTVESSVFVDVVSSLGHITEESLFTLYPNPAKELVYLDFGSVQNELLTVTVFDAAGRLVLENSFIGESRFAIDLGSFAVGFYEVRVSSESFLSFEKLVVVR